MAKIKITGKQLDETFKQNGGLRHIVCNDGTEIRPVNEDAIFFIVEVPDEQIEKEFINGGFCTKCQSNKSYVERVHTSLNNESLCEECVYGKTQTPELPEELIIHTDDGSSLVSEPETINRIIRYLRSIRKS